MSEQKTSPWIWVGLGCAAAIFLIAAGIVGIGFLGVRKAREVAEELETPEGRERAVLRTLGADRLPEGYYPVVGLQIPFVMDIAILSDLPPVEGADPEAHDFGERGFIYFKMITFGRQQQELRDFFEGRTNDPRVLRDNNIDLRVREVVGRGEVEHPAAEVLFVVHRGEVSAMGSTDNEGLISTILIDCPDDERMRMGIWFGPDPASEAPADELELTGTVGDPPAIASFLEPLRPCA